MAMDLTILSIHRWSGSIQVYYNLGNNSPQIKSLSNISHIEENSLFPEIWENYQTLSLPIYTIEADDLDNDTLSYSISGMDASFLSVDEDDGEVRLKLPSDYETKASYSFDVHVSDGELTDTQSVIINITDVEGDEFRVNTETFDLQPILKSHHSMMEVL